VYQFSIAALYQFTTAADTNRGIHDPDWLAVVILVVLFATLPIASHMLARAAAKEKSSRNRSNNRLFTRARDIADIGEVGWQVRSQTGCVKDTLWRASASEDRTRNRGISHGSWLVMQWQRFAGVA
jgi:hypothetical protein